MRRRLDLIASLVVAPPVLFLDEPTTGLDPRSRAEIWAAVRALAADGTTVLLTTQYLEEADQDRRPDRDRQPGPVTTHGTPDELKNSLGGRVDVVLSDAAGLDAPRPSWRIAGPAARLVAGERRPPPAVVAARGDAAELVRRLDAAGVKAEDVSVRRPTLNEVFLDRTRAAERDAA